MATNRASGRLPGGRPGEGLMLALVLIGLVGGLITGISPCVLPVLPVIFVSGGAQGARTAEPLAAPVPPTAARRDGRRPYLVVAGLALSFSAFTLLGTLVLSALPLPKDIIRWAGLIALIAVGIAMLVPRVQDLLERPFGRFLGLLVHQLPARDHARHGLVLRLPGGRVRGHRGAHARIRLRARPR
jgi:cytochrome c biogenesis protein CcdA